MTRSSWNGAHMPERLTRVWTLHSRVRGHRQMCFSQAVLFSGHEGNLPFAWPTCGVLEGRCVPNWCEAYT